MPTVYIFENDNGVLLSNDEHATEGALVPWDDFDSLFDTLQHIQWVRENEGRMLAGIDRILPEESVQVEDTFTIPDPTGYSASGLPYSPMWDEEGEGEYDE